MKNFHITSRIEPFSIHNSIRIHNVDKTSLQQRLYNIA
jgi:hypothetical protein